MTEVKIGMYVKVYQKPVTKEDFEAVARVTRVISQNEEETQVRCVFSGDDRRVVYRTLCEPIEKGTVKQWREGL